MILNKQFSVIIPAYNEGEGIAKVVTSLKAFLDSNYGGSEIIVINDGSKDGTSEVLEGLDGISKIDHPYNKGYGAALKTGIKNSSKPWIIFYDADGQFVPEEIKKLTDGMDHYDMITGVRLKKKAPIIRAPGRALLHFLANYLSDRKIPDLNCGFRLVKKEELMRFWHLLPDSYSFSTTTTLAFHKGGLNVKYVPVEIKKRESGKSGVRPKHAIRMFFLILRTIAAFSPLRVFMPIFILLSAMTSAFLAYDIYHLSISNTTTVLFLSSVIVFLSGILADQIAAIRRGLER